MSFFYIIFSSNINDKFYKWCLNRVTKSKNSDFPVGVHVFGLFGWRTRTVFNPERTEDQMIKP